MHGKTAKRHNISQGWKTMDHTKFFVHGSKLRISLCNFLILWPSNFFSNVFSSSYGSNSSPNPLREVRAMTAAILPGGAQRTRRRRARRPRMWITTPTKPTRKSRKASRWPGRGLCVPSNVREGWGVVTKCDVLDPQSCHVWPAFGVKYIIRGDEINRFCWKRKVLFLYLV